MSNVSRVTAVSSSVHVLPCLYAHTCLLRSAIPRNVDFNRTACVCKFCFKLQNTFTEIFKILQQVPGDKTKSHNRPYEWYRKFKDGRTSIEDDPRSGLLSPSTDDSLGEFELSFVHNDD